MENKTEEKQEQSEPTRPGNIYDVFVKNIFRRVLIFVDFLLNYADPNFVSKIDLEKISPASTHYVGMKGDERILDLVFSCPLKNQIDAKVMIVFEHAGNTFDDIPVRLLCYATSIWWSELKDGKKILSVIYFIVVRTGTQPHHGPYPKVSDWLTKDENGQLMGFVPEIHYYVVDLPAFDGDCLCGGPELRAAIGILKNMTEGNEDEFAQAMLPIAEIDDARQQIMITRDILEFVAKAFTAHHKRLEAKMVHQALKSIFNERTENMATTIFDEIRAEGEARGEARGRAEGEARGEARGRARAGQDIVLTALRKKFTKIPKRIETSIRGMSDPIALESLITDVIESRTLDEFENALR
ncbi:MAG: Rpn family recombination-promoting nuclease/putative transposase [Planctomycetaceae bacterium]|nr:Rpn family recombination-promoting nuclease/putative transposase [Planctomycetaceae bacterium]